MLWVLESAADTSRTILPILDGNSKVPVVKLALTPRPVLERLWSTRFLWRGETGTQICVPVSGVHQRKASAKRRHLVKKARLSWC